MFALKTLTNVLFDLCGHPEYISLLREEFERCAHDIKAGHVDALPLLDSIFKESARMHSVETSMSSGYRDVHGILQLTTNAFQFPSGERLFTTRP